MPPITHYNIFSQLKFIGSLVQCLNLKHWMDSTKFELLLRCLDSEFELAQSLALRILSYQVVNEDFLGFVRLFYYFTYYAILLSVMFAFNYKSASNTYLQFSDR